MNAQKIVKPGKKLDYAPINLHTSTKTVPKAVAGTKNAYAKIHVKNANSGQKMAIVTNPMLLKNAICLVATQSASVRIPAQRHAKIGRKMVYVTKSLGLMLIAQTHVNGIIVLDLHNHQPQPFQLQPLIAVTDAQNYALYGLAQTQMSPENVLEPVMSVAIQILLTSLTTAAAAEMVNMDNVGLMGHALNGATFLTG